MRSEISLDELFEEQREPVNLFLIKPLNEEFVRMKTWTPGERCSCGGFQKVPRAAIRRLRKTGTRTLCCGRTMHVVTVEFEESATLKYEEMFAALRSSEKRRAPRSVRRPRIPIVKPFTPPLFDTGGGDGDGMSNQDYVDCVQECLAENRDTEPPAKGSPAWFNWYSQVLNACSTACQTLYNGGSVIIFGDDDSDSDD